MQLLVTLIEAYENNDSKDSNIPVLPVVS